MIPEHVHLIFFTAIHNVKDQMLQMIFLCVWIFELKA